MKQSVSHRAAASRTSREADFYGWLVEQVDALRSSRPNLIDRERLSEEIEAMAASLRRALVSHLEVLLTHLLKWSWEPARRGGSWEASIANARDDLADLLADSPSLKTYVDESLKRAYRRARRIAGAEMGMDRERWERALPATCPWRLAEVLDDNFWPSGSPQNRATSRT
jgi:hypothetical protein